MNYYERHLGDYAKDTKHLSMLEHGAYGLLLDRYYSTEEGIPADQVYRVTGAKSKAERAAVDAVLAEFFSLSDGVWIKNRVEEEIQRYLDSIPAEEQKRNNDKERQRRARQRRKELFAELRCHGVIMPWNASLSQLQTELSRVTSVTGHGAVTPIVTCDNTAIHNPVPSPQSPDEDSRRGEDATSVDKAIYADARKIFGKSIGGQVSKAIGLRGKPWVLGVIEACRSKDQEGARAYFAAALNGAHKPDQAEQRKAIP
jgi:uncharacterized protein YdaU (DUF1376 family)